MKQLSAREKFWRDEYHAINGRNKLLTAAVRGIAARLNEFRDQKLDPWFGRTADDLLEAVGRWGSADRQPEVPDQDAEPEQDDRQQDRPPAEQPGQDP